MRKVVIVKVDVLRFDLLTGREAGMVYMFCILNISFHIRNYISILKESTTAKIKKPHSERMRLCMCGMV